MVVGVRAVGRGRGRGCGDGADGVEVVGDE